MEHTKHIMRAVLLLLVVAVAFVVVRHFAIPESFGGAHGHYRLASVAEFVAQAPVHGARGACAACHEDEAESIAAGPHSSVSCELCHAPLNALLEDGNFHLSADGEYQVAMPKNRSYKLCAWCHHKLEARPADFPQVVLHEHVAEGDFELKDDVCLQCHENPHDPSE